MTKKAAVETRFVDRPEVSETFADSLHSINFDGQAMRIVLCATRFDPPKATKAPTAARYPACRLVLTPNAAIDLFNRLQQIVKALEKSGAITKQPMPPQTIQ